jgi:hypothetical protein
MAKIYINLPCVKTHEIDATDASTIQMNVARTDITSSAELFQAGRPKSVARSQPMSRPPWQLRIGPWATL